ncbi:TetR/AcrR family transcriptional regulator, partial [Ruminococcus sp.]|uniref:TetR/AcrR family transcriptional regulator n=1 Tax=Ruminococcus sp. TaxID=41978 RepID=UPI00258DF419
MPRDKSESHEKILKSAVKEFMEYGFENASMRRIANEVGLTVGALYRHFPNKEEIFAVLVEPTISELMAKYQAFVEQGYEVMKCGDIQQLWNDSESETKWLMCFIYDHFEAFKLLICRSQGTRFERFVHDIDYFTPRKTPIRNKENVNPNQGTHRFETRNASIRVRNALADDSKPKC